MRYQMKKSQIWISHPPQLNKEVVPEETRDPGRVSECLHFHLDRKLMEVQQPWIPKIVWVTVQVHHMNKKAHGDRIHHSKEERKALLSSNPVNPRRSKSTSLLIKMRTIKNLEMNLEPLQILNLLHQYFLFILMMKTVNSATNTVTEVRSLRSDKWIGLDNDTCDTHRCRSDWIVFFEWLKMENNKTYASWSPSSVCNDHCI